MPPCDQASQTSPLSIARATLGGDRPCCDLADGAGSGSPMDKTDRPSPQDVPSNAGPSISDPTWSQAQLPARGSQKYDNRAVPFRLRPRGTGIGTSAASTLQQGGELRPFCTSSVRLKANVR
jgi:hypothetical protein